MITARDRTAARDRAAALLLPVAFAAPPLRRRSWRAFYQVLAGAEPEAFSLMNYGYAGAPALALDAPLETERFGYQLYHKVAAATDLRGLDVLEVGCGRGGGTAYLARVLGPRQAVGLDHAAAAIQLCRRRFQGPNLRFQVGDAMDLPFADASFDAVVSVESAFCYPSRPRFYAEVRRVLRDGGHFLYADIFDRRRVRAFEAALGRAGLVLELRETINAGVVAACEQDAGRRRALVDRLARSRITRAIAYNFVALPGTYIHRRLASGRRQYRVYRLRAEGIRNGH